VFLREDSGIWGPSHQQRPLEQASRLAEISPPVTFHALRHTHASQLAMRGVPMAVIAKQLGHADSRMTEKHYAHLAPNYVADTIRANFPNLGISNAPKVLPLRIAGKACWKYIAITFRIVPRTRTIAANHPGSSTTGPGPLWCKGEPMMHIGPSPWSSPG
jgi:hypothetical protein